ncbi:MAG TPA: NAD+ synthase [Actinomycetota bacterium]|nr:NAD+ synthase [Actinomycetota bacterium]
MVKVAMAQLNLMVGDIEGNLDRIFESIDRADAEGAQILALPELAITGYPPEDLLLKGSFVRANQEALKEVAKRSGDLVVVTGFVHSAQRLYNAAAICHRGEVLAVYKKHLLPNYGVFDEHRYFEPGRGHFLIETADGVIGVCVCEDAWSDKGPLVSQGDAGAQLVININASPYHKDKLVQREQMLCERARRAKTSIVYVNMVGGQDELVFDGGSLVIDPSGEPIARSPQFEEHLSVVDVPLGEAGHTDHPSVRRLSVELRTVGPAPAPVLHPPKEGLEEVYEALCLSLRDYARKNGFTKIVLGLSGGIDSALTAVIAADALGPENVLGVTMPSHFSSSHSVDDSAELAENLGTGFVNIPIAHPYDTYLSLLEEPFGPTEMGLAEENLQARIRGTLLMTISNRYGHLVIATGNKSEVAVGYATLYGDMAGGWALLKDVFKTEVYALARFRNGRSPVIPENILTKAPSAELRPDQRDSDSLPPYEVLDPILEAYIEDDAGVGDITRSGFDKDTVLKVVRLVDRAEYKRRQAAPGPKVTVKAFGRDRRLPITNGWKDEARFH